MNKLLDDEQNKKEKTSQKQKEGNYEWAKTVVLMNYEWTV